MDNLLEKVSDKDLTKPAPTVIEKYNNHKGPVSIPAELDRVIPREITECAIFLSKKHGEPCSDAATLTALGAALNITSAGDNALSPAGVLAQALKKTQCTTEKCALEKALGKQRVKAVIATRFKIAGPTDITLLNNYNIDDTLQQFRNKYPKFYPYNFNMYNYREYSFSDGGVLSEPDSLETIRVGDLTAKYNCCACVINTDVYQGRGKHWMALFADWRDRGAATVEFFNSSGNAPGAPWVLWMTRARDSLASNGIKLRTTKDRGGFDTALIKVTDKRHQQSKTECGIYALFYIYCRLCNIPPEYFNDNFIPDQIILQFRQHLFDGADSQAFIKEFQGKFDWDEYTRRVKVRWEDRP